MAGQGRCMSWQAGWQAGVPPCCQMLWWPRTAKPPTGAMLAPLWHSRCITPSLVQVLASAHDWPALQGMAGRLDRKSGLTMEHFIAAAR